MRDERSVRIPGKPTNSGDSPSIARPALWTVKPTPYVIGSFLSLVGSCCFFAGGFATKHAVDLHHDGSAAFGVGSSHFACDGYCASLKPAQR
jgi:hypothetical protein